MVFLFETSWEVCNKVGGIHTVIKSKAQYIKQKYKNYYLIGPYIEKKSDLYFEKLPLPKIFQKSAKNLFKKGIIVYFGEWQIPGKPKVFLIDFKKLIQEKNELKTWYWNNFRIDSLFSSWEFEEPLVWATAVGMFIEEILKSSEINEKIILHAHEWLAGFSLLYAKAKKLPVATVFTTHATMLGRTLAGNGVDLYAMLDKINPEEEARKYNIIDKFTAEKAMALNSDVFTTVSEITAMEAEHFFGRRPDVLVLNGLDVSKHPTFEETSVKHTINREIIREFCKYYFFPYYYFDLEHTIFFFTASRYEFRNKGLDIFVEALGRLNKLLKKANTKRTIVTFFFVPAANLGIRRELLENKTFYRQIYNFVQEHNKKLVNNIVDSIIANKKLETNEILPEDIVLMKKRFVAIFKRQGLPPLSTHKLINENQDPLIKAFQENGLLNRAEDKVKVVFYPVYLNGTDGLLDLSYENAISGMHLGVFPSYYEPWGYTPSEAMALSVSAVTTDLAGFGRYMQKIVKDEKYPGLFILKRLNRNHEETIHEFTQLLYTFARYKRHERVINKLHAKALVQYVDWALLVDNYLNAYELALKKL